MKIRFHYFAELLLTPPVRQITAFFHIIDAAALSLASWLSAVFADFAITPATLAVIDSHYFSSFEAD
jgi:hypothetical protein